MRTFLGFGQTAYIGQPQSFPIKLGSIAGAVVPLLVQWISYGASTARPNINILVDLRTKQNTKLDQIRSVYIDNLGSDVPIYVYFPDTSYTVVAKPNSEGWYPAFTADRVFWIIGEGFLDGHIPQTGIQVCNIPLIPSVNVEIDQAVSLARASPIITRGTSIYNSSFGIPALGDQFFVSNAVALQISGDTAGLWNTPYATGFLYITGIDALAWAIQGAAGGGFVIESTGIAGALITIGFQATAGVVQGNQSLLSLPSLQLKLDATQTWRVRNVNNVTSGSLIIASSFTQQP